MFLYFSIEIHHHSTWWIYFSVSETTTLFCQKVCWQNKNVNFISVYFSLKGSPKKQKSTINLNSNFFCSKDAYLSFITKSFSCYQFKYKSNKSSMIESEVPLNEKYLEKIQIAKFTSIINTDFDNFCFVFQNHYHHWMNNGNKWHIKNKKKVSSSSLLSKKNQMNELE